MTLVPQWTGFEARALRLALRMSVRAFAEHLGVAVRTVSKWEKLLAATAPRPDTQAILDTALRRADPAARLRFQANVTSQSAQAPRGSCTPPLTTGRGADHESWADDLDRAAIALSHQDFTFAGSLLHRWLGGVELTRLDERGTYLAARSSSLFGDLMRDQGLLLGVLSAEGYYRQTRELYARLDLARRVAQADLMLVLVNEMRGRHRASIAAYEHLADDARLSGRDRARARLWLGRSLSKVGENLHAVRVLNLTAREFENLEEPMEWSVAQQKIALAHRGAGDLAQAVHHIALAQAGGRSPLQQVRLSAAQGHILVSDPATREAGLGALRDATELATLHGLGHQLRSIEGIRRAQGLPPAVLFPKEGGGSDTGGTGGRAGAGGGERRAVARRAGALGVPGDGARGPVLFRGGRSGEP
ncbi:MAG: hypothetical protein FWE15_14940 [Actinomycetia bacterium]|nr:hypothetical protein [Actinomycetes bacterium]